MISELQQDEGQIRFRAIEREDTDYILEVENDRTQWPDNGIMAPWSRTRIEEYVSNYSADPYSEGQLRLMVVDSNGIRVGIADLYEINPLSRNALTAIYITPRERGKGLGEQAVTMLCQYAHDYLGLRTLGARIASTNPASVRMFQKAGFDISGRLKDWLLVRNQPTDLVIMQKLME